MTSQHPKCQTKKRVNFRSPRHLFPQNPNYQQLQRCAGPKRRTRQAIPVEPISENLTCTEYSLLHSMQRSIPPYTPPLGYIESTASSGVSEALGELLYVSSALLGRLY